MTIFGWQEDVVKFWMERMNELVSHYVWRWEYRGGDDCSDGGGGYCLRLSSSVMQWLILRADDNMTSQHQILHIISPIFLRSRINRDLAICFYVRHVEFLRSRPIVFSVCRNIWLGPDTKICVRWGSPGTYPHGTLVCRFNVPVVRESWEKPANQSKGSLKGIASIEVGAII